MGGAWEHAHADERQGSVAGCDQGMNTRRERTEGGRERERARSEGGEAHTKEWMGKRETKGKAAGADEKDSGRADREQW